MRSIISFLIITLFAFGLVINEASAKRFGGGRSFGTYRSAKSFSSPYGNKSTKARGARTNTNRWGGILGGLLIGGLLGSLFMNHGLAGGLISWLIVGSLIFFLVNFFRRKMQPSFQQSANQEVFTQNPIESFKRTFSAINPSPSATYSNRFEAEDFLREAKVKFIRLQEAYDKKNLVDLSEFTSPEVLAEIKLQFQEREEEFNLTNVMNLEAELVNLSHEGSFTLASVHFTGLVEENNNPAEALDEIWHFRQSADNMPWIVCGVQQKAFA